MLIKLKCEINKHWVKFRQYIYLSYERCKNEGIHFTINQKEHYHLPILGTHNMKNAAIAIAIDMN